MVSRLPKPSLQTFRDFAYSSAEVCRFRFMFVSRLSWENDQLAPVIELDYLLTPTHDAHWIRAEEEQKTYKFYIGLYHKSYENFYPDAISNMNAWKAAREFYDEWEKKTKDWLTG